MEDQSQLLADVLLEDKITDLWPEYPPAFRMYDSLTSKIEIWEKLPT